MLEDMAARKFGPHSQRSHIESCKRFAAFLKRSPAATADIPLFQRHLIEAGLSLINRWIRHNATLGAGWCAQPDAPSLSPTPPTPSCAATRRRETLVS